MGEEVVMGFDFRRDINKMISALPELDKIKDS